MTDFIGRIFDRKYRVTRLIGEGGMGAVYEAEHTVIQRKVAVKVMHAEFSSMQEVVDRFFREAQASSAIGHPNIIEVYDVGIERDGTVFIVMELLHGETLADKMKKGERLAPESAVAIILQVLSALVVAHDKGIIHRDLKPDNVFLSVDARGRHEVKLLDFGIAKVQSTLDGDQGLTKTGTVLGTPNYMSPEQARGREVDHRIDIWAAGVMMYELLTGRLPYPGDSYNEVLSKILLDDPPPLERMASGLHPGLVNVVERAMAKDREDRYPTVAVMIEELLPYHQGEGEMTDSAATALKRSLAPPPPVGQQDTMLATDPDLIIGNANIRGRDPTPVPTGGADDFAGGLGNLEMESGIRGLELGAASPAMHGMASREELPTPDGPRRRWPLRVFLVVMLLLISFAGIAYLNKGDNESFGASAQRLASGAIAFFEDKTEDLPPMPKLSDFTAGLPSKPAPMPEVAPVIRDAGVKAEDAGAAQDKFKEQEESASKEVKIELKGLPKRARITMKGKKVKSPLTLPRGKKAVKIKITAYNHKPLVKTIVPDKDQTLKLKMKKWGKAKKGKAKKKSR
jgi:hypothetical protein